MGDLERLEFRRMLWASSAAHAIVLLSVLLVTSASSARRYIGAGKTGPLDVMWAAPVGGLQQTPPHKLPGPLLSPSMLPPPPAAEPAARIVMPEDAKAKAAVEKIRKELRKEAAEEEARRKAMAEALAKVTRETERRPLPRPDNFPSDATTGKGGLPGGQGAGEGIVGALGGDPLFGGYRSQIVRVITDNFIWLPREQNLRAEVSVRIDAAGAVVASELAKGSGNAAFDRAALRAVQKSSPLPAPPESLAAEIVRQEFIINFIRSAQ